MSLQQVWDEIKKIGDEVVPVLVQIEEFVQAGKIPAEHGRAMQLACAESKFEKLGKIGDGHLIEAFGKILPQLIQLLPIIIAAFGGGAAPPAPKPAPTPGS